MTLVKEDIPSEVEPAPSPRGEELALRRGTARGRSWGYRGAYWTGGALLAAAIVAVVVSIADGSASGLTHFLSSGVWDPENPQLSPGPLVVDTLVVTAVAMALAVPVGLGTAIALAEVLPRRVAGFISSIVDLIAGVPSIVIGLWALIVLEPLFMRDVEPALSHVPWLGHAIFGGPAYGTGLLLASTVLAIMVLPTLSSLSRAALLGVPRADREAARALGATGWQAVRKVLLPTARSGIGAAITLAIGRALGESIAVALVIGGSTPGLPTSLTGQGATLGSAIVNQFTESTPGTDRSSIIALGAILLVLTLVVSACGRALWGNARRSRAQGEAVVVPGVPMVPIAPVLAAASVDGTGSIEGNSLVGTSPDNGSASVAVLTEAAPDRPEPPAAATTYRPWSEGPLADLQPAQIARRTLARRLWTARALQALCAVLVLVALAPLVALVGFTLVKGIPGLSWSFLTKPANPLSPSGGGISTAIAGTLKIVGLALVMAVPVSLLGALFLFENNGRLATALRTGTEVLAGVPSIVIGIFAYSVVIVPLHHPSMLGASIAVAVLMLPIMTRANEEAIRAVPADLHEAGAALGARRGRVVRSVVLRTSLPGLVSGNLLALARSLGETAPLLFTLAAPTMAMTLTIYTDAQELFGTSAQDAWATALVLLIGVLSLSLAARGVAAHLTRKAR